MFPGIICTCLILATLLVATSQEECANRHPQHVYCNNSKVFRVEFVSRINQSNLYMMEFVYRYKGNYRRLIGANDSIKVEVSSNVTLTNGIYVIAGRRKRKHFLTSECNGALEWDKLTCFQKMAFYSQYSEGCGDCVSHIYSMEYYGGYCCFWKYAFYRRINYTCTYNTAPYDECATELSRRVQLHLSSEGCSLSDKRP